MQNDYIHKSVWWVLLHKWGISLTWKIITETICSFLLSSGCHASNNKAKSGCDARGQAPWHACVRRGFTSNGTLLTTCQSQLSINWIFCTPTNINNWELTVLQVVIVLLKDGLKAKLPNLWNLCFQEALTWAMTVRCMLLQSLLFHVPMLNNLLI